MKVALVHELLTMRGGAERVLRVVAKMFPEAPIYTLLYDEKKLGDWFPRERIRFSNLQKFAGLSTNHHLYLRRFPKAVESWDFSEFDLVISFSSAFAHGIMTTGKTKHISYVHTPARYLWDRTFDVLDRACGIGAQACPRGLSAQRYMRGQPAGMSAPLKRWYLERTFHKLREWDAMASERGNLLLAASKATQRRIELYWRRESDVLYPPVEMERFPLYKGKREDYYVVVSTLAPYKRIDLAIDACNTLKKNLKIIGEGQDRKSLDRHAGKTVELLGYLTHKDLMPILQKAKGFIFPGEEDFGIAPIEAMACGTPVIAFGKGGALETVEEGKTGIFFTEPTSAALMTAIQQFERQSFDPNVCRRHAEEFSKERFEREIRAVVARLSEPRS